MPEKRREPDGTASNSGDTALCHLLRKSVAKIIIIIIAIFAIFVIIVIFVIFAIIIMILIM